MTVALLKSRRRLHDPDFERLAYALARMRRHYGLPPGFLLTAWVFLPDHWHAIIYPPYPLTILRVFQAVKVSSMIAINVRLGEVGETHSLRSGQGCGKAGSLRCAQGRFRPGVADGGVP
ncbi:MAG: hypothetical protein ACLQOO_23330 [Terriglobia bacterium]